MRETPGRMLRALSALLGVVIIGGGAMKLLGQAAQVAAFTSWGLPTWFRALVGTFEVVGGGLLIVPKTTPVGSLILATIMVGALWAHAANGEWPHLAPAAILLTLFLAIFRQNRARAVQLLGGA